VDVEISFCVVNTSGRDLLMRCLNAIADERAALSVATEVLVLDNASDDGSAEAVRDRGEDVTLIALRERRGKAQGDSELMARARGRFCLLLNEDSELRPGASGALREALSGDERAGCAVAALRRPDGRPQASAWRFPTVATSLEAAIGLAGRNVQSTGRAVRAVDWGQSCALAVRREAALAVGFMDKSYFVYGEEVDFQRRLADAGWHTLYVPEALVIHHEQLSTGALPQARIVENSRGRDRYVRQHHGRLAAAMVRCLVAWTYACRSLVALVLPRHNARRYRAHAVAALLPNRGEGLREAAARYNAGRSGVVAASAPDAEGEGAGAGELAAVEEPDRAQEREDQTPGQSPQEEPQGAAGGQQQLAADADERQDADQPT
jgi:GT2 family glycosyltransferase